MRRSLQAVLVLAALGQLAVLSWGLVRQAPPPPTGLPNPVRKGDQVVHVPGEIDGRPTGFALRRPEGEWTALLAFASDCVHSKTVAAEWSRWLGLHHPFEVVGITRDSPDAASAYREQNRWHLRTLHVARDQSSTPSAYLVSRTPWVFLFDDHGVLRYEGHGSNVTALDSIILAETEIPVQSPRNEIPPHPQQRQ